MKLTPWFPGTVKPVRVGVYERMPSFTTAAYSYWNGRFWVASAKSKAEAADPEFFDLPAATQAAQWRGLAERPAK